MRPPQLPPGMHAAAPKRNVLVLLTYLLLCLVTASAYHYLAI